MKTHEAQKIVRRLAAAEGYLELELPDYALAELDRVEDPGAFEGIAQLLRGEAYQAQSRFGEAIPALNRAAELFPAPFNHRALLGLSICYRENGQVELADQAEAQATPPDTPPGTKMQVVIVPIFQVANKSSRRSAIPEGDAE